MPRRQGLPSVAGMTITPTNDPRTCLHTGYRQDDYDSLLDLPVDSFVGIDECGAAALERLGVMTLFDLAHAAVFGAAAILQAAADDPTHPFRLLGRIDPELVDGDGAYLSVEEWPLQPIRLVAGLGQVLAPLIEESFDLHTIGDLAMWSPYRAAVEIVRLAAGTTGAPDPDTGTPSDLLPANGQYPTDKVYYRSLFARHFNDADGGIEMDPSTGLDLAYATDSTSTGVGYGAYVTWEQLWYGQGLVLGNLLHSLALAPGEATMVAIVDWTREVSTSALETVDQIESLQASTSQNRALSEVTSGVVTEIQNGFSTTAASATTQGAGASTGGAGSGSGTIPGTPFSFSLGGGFGLSGGIAESSSNSMTVASSSGSRESMAEYGQQVSEATQQKANSARSRRASIVQEVRESTSEQLQTRVVANYNHMHAMSVQYYEIVQIYRVVFQAARAEKCAFVPITPLDFSDDAVIERFAGILAAVSTDPYVLKVVTTPIRISLVAPVAGATYVRLPMTTMTIPRSLDIPVGDLPLSGRTRSSAVGSRLLDNNSIPADSLDWWQTGSLGSPLVVPGPIEVSPTGRLTFIEATAGSQSFGVTLNLLDRSFGVAGDVDEPLLQLQTVDVALPDDSSASEITLEIGVTTGTIEQRYRITMATDTAEPGTFGSQLTALVVVGGDVSAIDLAMAKAHLTAEAAWYTARIWERLGTTSVSALLAKYRYGGRPLLSAIDPRVVAVTGTHAVFRMLLDADQQAEWVRELEEWGLTGPTSRREDVVPLPTGGVFAEAVLGRSNSAEILDMTRFWNWQDSPPPFAPPAIAELQAGQQTPTDAPVPGSLDAPIVNMVQPNPMPDPTGLAATLGLLGASGIFRDMSFGGENAAAASGAAAASAAAQIAAVAAAQQAFATAAALAGTPSVTGALMNAAKAGLPGAYEHLVPPSLTPPPVAGSPGSSGSDGSSGTSLRADGAGGSDGDPGGSTSDDDTGSTGGGSSDTDEDDEPADEPQATATRDFHLRLAVAAVDGSGEETSYDWVRLDAAELLVSLVPSELLELVQMPLDIFTAWQDALGLDGEDADAMTGVVEFLGTWASGVGEAATMWAALESLLDLLRPRGRQSRKHRGPGAHCDVGRRAPDRGHVPARDKRG